MQNNSKLNINNLQLLKSKKILVTGTAGFIGHALAKKLLDRGDIVVGIDNINDYYDVNLKHARLNDLGINGTDALASAKNADENNIAQKLISSTKYKNHKFIKLDLSNTNAVNKLFELEKFDAVMNLAAQAGVRYSLENPHAYIQSNVVGFMNILEACRNYSVKNLRMHQVVQCMDSTNHNLLKLQTKQNIK